MPPSLAQNQAQLAEATQALGAPGDANYRIQAAQVALGQANLNLSWTKIVAPSDGYVTNLNIDVGDYVPAGGAVLAFVDSSVVLGVRLLHGDAAAPHEGR